MVAITVLHHNASDSRRAIDAAFTELEAIEASLSLYRPDSQVSQLNRHGELANPTSHLSRLLQVAQDTSDRTEGAFDISVQPLWELYADAQKVGQLPSDRDVEIARRQVGWKRVRLGRDRVELRGDGTRITLNGLAQGYAADRVLEILRTHGIDHALIDTGEISTLGNRSPHDDWTVGIQHPRNEDAYISLARLAGRCLATSGDYATTFTPDRRHHHLFNPDTGHSPAEFSSVSIVADTALTADVLSTALFVMGLDRGLAFIREFVGVDAFVVLKNGQTVKTAGFPVA
jgi:thiamine biosynthesis lipoprotein